MTVNSIKLHLHIGALQKISGLDFRKDIASSEKNNKALKLFGMLLKINYKGKMRVLNLLPAF